MEEMVSRGVRDRRVLKAMLKVPRHLFVDKAFYHKAYDNYPLPIGQGQTISQPYIVATMTEKLMVCSKDRILEIGTGSGYQTAILAELASSVYTVERVKELSLQAQERLKSLGYDNVFFKIGDGSIGWAEYAPYDGIIVTASTENIPPLLLEQLSERGRMVIPLHNSLLLVRKRRGRIISQKILDCKFVPLIEDSGSGAVVSAPGSGPGGRWFKSSLPDGERE